MNDGQIDIFGDDGARAHARRTDPDTSQEATRQITPSLRQLQLHVLEYAATRGDQGFIDPEMLLDLESMSSTYRTRRSELVDLGLVEDTGRRSSGGGRSTYAVWRITEAGRSAWASELSASFRRAA